MNKRHFGERDTVTQLTRDDLLERDADDPLAGFRQFACNRNYKYDYLTSPLFFEAPLPWNL